MKMKKVLALLLALVMVGGMLPAQHWGLSLFHTEGGTKGLSPMRTKCGQWAGRNESGPK